MWWARGCRLAEGADRGGTGLADTGDRSARTLRGDGGLLVPVRHHRLVGPAGEGVRRRHLHDSANDTIGGTGPIEGVTTTVDVGQHKFNFGLTGTLKVLAWYHTHPLKEKLDDKGNMMHFMWDKFEGGDKWISDDKRVLGFVGMMDGSFWRYDPAPEALDGKYGPGGWQKLNPRLPLKPATLLLPTEDRWSPAAPTLAPRPASGPSRTRRPPR